MKKNKSLKIIKYNKKLQKRLNISINDYEEYSQIYTTIEIEFKLDEDEYDGCSSFIKIPDKEKLIIKLNHFINYLIIVNILIQYFLKNFIELI